MNQKLRHELLTMENADRAMRQKLVDNGELFDKRYDYHPEMKKIHEANNKEIREIITKYGWPGFSLVDQDGCAAAWLIVQHAVLEPQLQEQCLNLLEKAVKQDNAHPWMYALLLDRVLVHKGELQIYGSQHFVNAEGKLIPYPIKNPKQVDQRRKQVGLEPLANRTAEIQTERNKSRNK